MSMPDNTYRLVVFDPPDDPQAVRDLMCGVTGIHPTDAMQWVARRAPGVWPQPLAEGEVRELLDGLYELGVPAEAWRIDLLPDLSPVRTIHDAACLPEGFRVKGLRGEATHWVPWDRIEIVERRPDHARRRVSQRGSAELGRGLGHRSQRHDRPRAQVGPPRPGHADSARAGRRGAHRPPRPSNLFPDHREPDELRLAGRAPAGLGRGELPLVPRRSVRPGRNRPSSLRPRARSSSMETRPITSSPRLKPCSNTPLIASSGAGIAATATPRARRNLNPGLTEEIARRARDLGSRCVPGRDAAVPPLGSRLRRRA